MEEFCDALQPDAHSRFQRWRRTHPNGYFLTQKGRHRFNLHHVHCPHVGNDNWEQKDFGRSLTSHRKICSVTDEELRRWANTHGMVVSCMHCMPDE
jgi:hypothetical protein